MTRDVETSISAVCPGGGLEKFAEFLTDLAPVGPATARKYLAVVRGLLAKSEKFSVDQAAQYVKKKNRIYVRAAVVKFIEFLEHEGIVQEDEKRTSEEVLAGMISRLPKVKEPPARSREIPESQEILRVIDAFDKDDRMIARFMLYTGCRVHEAVGVKVKDINFVNGNITIYGKGRLRKKPRPGKIPMDYAADLEAYAKSLGLLEGEYVFWPDSKAKISSRATMFRDKLREISLEILGRPMGTHDIRRFYGSYLYEQTRDIQLVQKTLGHSKIETTQKYTQFATREQQLNQARDIMSRLGASKGSLRGKNKAKE